MCYTHKCNLKNWQFLSCNKRTIVKISHKCNSYSIFITFVGIVTLVGVTNVSNYVLPALHSELSFYFFMCHKNQNVQSKAGYSFVSQREELFAVVTLWLFTL